MSDFDTAVIQSKQLTSKPSNDELLNLYGTHPRTVLLGAFLLPSSYLGHYVCLRMR
jgi:hypothetical protein